MFNEDDGEIIVKGEKNILKYSKKDEEYWLVNVDEYLIRKKRHGFSNSNI